MIVIMKLIGGILGIFVLASGAFFVYKDNTVEIVIEEESSGVEEVVLEPREDGDLHYQEKLQNPPKEIKAIYVTSWVAATPSLFNGILKKIEGTDINALIIDVKDYSGFIGYNTDNELVKKYNAEERRIKHLNRMVADLHERGIYIIARVTVFQDPRLALARPDLAVLDSKGNVWQDRHKLAWMSPTSREVWDYTVSIAKELDERGIDEINFDYVRFPTDGVGVNNLVYKEFDGSKTKREVIKEFFSYLRKELPDVVISADIFGQTVISKTDMGIGQMIEDAYDSFDYIAPMIYPSHFIKGFIGFDNPGAHPYEVVKYSVEEAVKRLELHERTLAQGSATTTPALTLEQKERVSLKLRPWIQDFDLGADYTVEMVRVQMDAIEEAGGGEDYMIWNPSNKYRDGIFNTVDKDVDL